MKIKGLNRRNLWVMKWFPFYFVLFFGINNGYAQHYVSCEEHDDAFTANKQEIPNDSFLISLRASDTSFVNWYQDEIRNDIATVSGEDTITLSSSFFIFRASDTLVKEQLTELDRYSPIDLRYNGYVKAFIRMYTEKKPEVLARSMARMPYYEPLFVEMLDKYDLPLELKYLPVVESALDPLARSRAGARGLWQFMYRTGKMYGLNVTSYYDERCDPYLSTEAACKYLKKLHSIYGDWLLVIAAYNCGPGNVNKAIRRSGGYRDYWQIRKWLPRETRGYVPAFISATYLFEQDLKLDYYPEYEKMNVRRDTVKVKQPLYFSSVDSILNIDLEEIQWMNPVYKLDYIPGGEQAVLTLPANKMAEFFAMEDSLYRHTEILHSKPDMPTPVKRAKPTGELMVYVVQPGDVLGSIAENHHCSVSQIKDWNNMWSSRIYPGQRLKLYPGKKVVVAKKVEKPKSVPVKDENYVYHIVRPGDTLWDIAKEYGSVDVKQLMQLNSDMNYKNLKPGDKIRISKRG